MVGVRSVVDPSSLRTEFVRTIESASRLEIEARMPSEIRAISPLVDQLIRLIEESRCVAGGELAVELALREALGNAVVHGNRLDPGKLVHVHCRCHRSTGLSIVVKDFGGGFDHSAVPDPLAADHLEADHGRGLLLMRSQMDEVSFRCGGTEVHMSKRPASKLKRKTRSSKESDGRRLASTAGPGGSDISKQLRPMRARGNGTC
jgi:serine/threonine-protein kinase RsbW